jgi:putative ABC transport system permease protein
MWIVTIGRKMCLLQHLFKEFIVFVGLRDLWFAKGRFLLMTTVVALVAFLVIMLSGLTAGLAAENTSAIANMPATHIVFQDTPDAPTFGQSRIDGDVVDEWAAQPGVTEAAPLGVSRATMAVGESAVGVVLFGAEAGSFIAPDELDGTGSVVVSESVAETHGLTAGEPVMIGDTSYTVTVADRDESFSHSPVVWMALPEWQRVNGTGDAVSVVALETTGAFDGTAVDGTVVRTTSGSFASIGSFSAENGSLEMIRWFLLAISALVIGAFFTVWTIQRRHDVAVLKAMGASTRYLLIDALGQAAIVLVGAAAIGGLAGFAVGALVSGSVPFVTSLATAVPPLAMLVGLGLVGAALAIRTITKVDPLTALGGN